MNYEKANQSISKKTNKLLLNKQREEREDEKNWEEYRKNKNRRDKRSEKIINLLDKHYGLHDLRKSIENGDYAAQRGTLYTDDILIAYRLRRHLVNDIAAGAFSSDEIYEKFGRYPKIPEG